MQMTSDAPAPLPQKVAIVTGASQGIGAGLVDGFRAAGYAVVGTARTMPPSEESDYATVAGDIADPAASERVVGEALDRFGRIDTLVNNAGIYLGKPFADHSVEDFDAIVAVNLGGFFHITQRVIGHMADQGAGHVVNISTSLVDHADSSRPAALTALTKGGLVAVAKSLAIEYASRGVRVNAVSLGVIETPAHDDASYAGMAALHPIGRLGEVNDVVEGILYLERATFVTGEVLHIDGGQSAGH
jgi:NAD(P)-dependent dehydrogenase (short-subunit alcohol dehydrogenase family)